MIRSLLSVASVLFVYACASAPQATPARTLGPGEQWLPIAVTDANGVAYLCNTSNEIGGPALELLGSPSDPRLTWTTRLGVRLELAWPVGYSARFTPGLEVLDQNDNVVAHGGELLLKACATAVSGIFTPWLASGVWPPEHD